MSHTYGNPEPPNEEVCQFWNEQLGCRDPDCKFHDKESIGSCGYNDKITTFDQDFKEKVKEIIDEMEITYIVEEFNEIVKFAKRFYDMGKEG